MNLRPRRPRDSDINLTPLIDVVFLLLIFFMVSTTFKDEARLRIQLPQAEGEDVPSEEPALIRLAIDRSGAYYVDDRAVVDRTTLTLVRALNGALGERRDLPVLIQADAETPHQAVMTALDAAAQVGLARIAFSATRAEPARRAEGSAGGGSQGAPTIERASATRPLFPDAAAPGMGEGRESVPLPIGPQDPRRGAQGLPADGQGGAQ